MSMDELIRLFDLHRCSKSGAKFDYKKGIWFNHTYIQQKSDKEIAELFVPVLKEHGVEAPFEKVVTVVGMMKDRVSFVKELWEVCSFFFVAPTEYDEKTVKKRWKEDSAKCMTELAEVLAGIEDFSIEGQEKIVMDWIAEKGYHTGNIMNAFRLTLVGEGKGPYVRYFLGVGKRRNIGSHETCRRGFEIRIRRYVLRSGNRNLRPSGAFGCTIQSQTPEDDEGALGGVRSSSPTGRERRALHLVSRRFSVGV